LTDSEFSIDGTGVRLGLLDDSGEPVTVELPVPLASSLLLTLPCLIAACLGQSHGPEARLVFPVGAFTLECASEPGVMILTLRTPDGFAASFGFSSELAQDLSASIENLERIGGTMPLRVLN
jgi:hypothetical protein